jgi:Domain of unknown function (DUF1772)
MTNLARILNLLSVVSLSLFSGAFLFIAFVVVRFWQAVEPDVFLSWMSDHFFRFPAFMVPLNMISLLLTIAAFGTAWKSRPASRIPLGLSLFFFFTCTITYPIYFAGANAEFLNRAIASSFRAVTHQESALPQISDAIHTWATWHWARTGLAIAALTCASWGLYVSSSEKAEAVA